MVYRIIGITLRHFRWTFFRVAWWEHTQNHLKMFVMVCCKKNIFFWFNVLTFWTSSIVIHHFLNRVHPWSLSQLDAARMADTYRYESYKNGFPILCASDYCAAATAAAAAVQPPNRRHRCRRLVHLCVFSRFSASKASSMSTILMYYGAESTWTKVAVTANLLLVNLWGKRFKLHN